MSSTWKDKYGKCVKRSIVGCLHIGTTGVNEAKFRLKIRNFELLYNRQMFLQIESIVESGLLNE